jgi:hypothetical protein
MNTDDDTLKRYMFCNYIEERTTLLGRGLPIVAAMHSPQQGRRRVYGCRVERANGEFGESP